ncbi:hypothetical protein [Carnobacterium maltaromaticum]|uniref:hypothetical protein n=1 Tax=Carnobacterium maltaromaticum TaxID=2751 RepID=UPI0012FCBDF6|nr:hypothetical protein [Carnobacterium maltaromaticum]
MNEVKLVNHEKAYLLVDELGQKLVEANAIAKQLTSTTIQVQDVRGGKENINEYLKEVEKQFFDEYGFYPDSIQILAEGRSQNSRQKLTLALPLFQIQNPS